VRAAQLLPEAYGATPQQVVLGMIEKLEGLLEDYDVQVTRIPSA
jgi:hypothetical protein